MENDSLEDQLKTLKSTSNAKVRELQNTFNQKEIDYKAEIQKLKE